MSIATKRGDGGQTGLVGGVRVSKGELRVEAYGTVDELISTIGFARSICEDPEVREIAKALQRELFAVASAIATPPDSKKSPPAITAEMVDALTEQVHRIEKMEGVLADWAIPGEVPASAAFDMARTVCRRAERCAVRLADLGEAVNPQIVAYINRMSDLLWLLGRLIEMRAGVDASLRDENHKGPRWSRAW
ncbi:MAG TPA: cob(I)yrinic acid a,c-diamide adenosyltransferase [Blastocatellia bacterium]|jgi:cob(I)alamin adenosyltransferase